MKAPPPAEQRNIHVRIHPDIFRALPLSMIDPTVRYPQPLPGLLARWYVYLPDEGHSIMAAPAGFYRPDSPTENLVAVPVMLALRSDYTVARTGHLIMKLPLRPGRGGIRIDEHDREFA